MNPVKRQRPIPPMHLPEVIRVRYRNAHLGVQCTIEIPNTKANRSKSSGPFTLHLLSDAELVSEWRP